MQVDARDFAEFYQKPLGKQVAQELSLIIQDPEPKNPQDLVIGLGYSQPYLDGFCTEKAQKLALMPATLGAVQASPVPQAMCLPHLLPLRDASVQSALIVHGFEHAEYPKLVLREVWRVLQDAGSVTIAVPYRRGLWARNASQPFGLGTPYSTRQLRTLLEANGYCIDHIDFGLDFPPILHLQRLVTFLMRLCPFPAGVLVIRARKSLIQPVQNLSKTFNREKILPPVRKPQQI